MPSDEKTFGVRIAEERAAIGMTQTLLAELAGIDRDKLSKIEHGRRKVTQEEGVRLARVLGLSAEELVAPLPKLLFRDRVQTPEAAAAVELFERYIRNWEAIEQLRDFGDE